MVITKIKSFGFALTVIALLGLGACEKYFGNVNVDPDAPNDASVSSILIVAETRLVYTIGGDFSRYASVFTQHVDGDDRQFAGYQNYTFAPGDFSTPWDNLYAGVLPDLKQLKVKADASGYNAYSGIARALEAHTLMMIADYWGDAPYSTALDAEKTLQPTYDTQAKLYEAIFTLLAEARTKLAAAPGGIKPSASNDIIYSGSTAKWTKYCNVLAARAYLHLAKADAGNYAKALAELAKGGFASSADDARFTFIGGGAGIGNAPWSQYNEQRGPDIVVGKRYVKMLDSLADPRKVSYGAVLDDTHPIFTPTQAVPLLTFTEQKFIEAECKMKGGDAPGAKTAMLAGIAASFGDAGVDAAKVAPYTAQASVNPATVTMNQIMVQKYIALFTDPEVFNDWRRTGIPSLKPNLGSFIPRRFLYPQTELDLNSNVPKGVKTSDRVAWDK